MSGLQAPQVGVAVVTVDMFREYQRQVATTFELHGNQIAMLKERVQTMEGRIQSLEDAEDMAIDAVREIRDEMFPRIQEHHDKLDTLTVAVARQNTILDALGSIGQELRANQNRDAARPGQLAWRPGPLGGGNDQMKSTLEDFKSQLARSFASLAEHDRRLGENDTRLGTHDRHLTEHDSRLGEHNKGLQEHSKGLAAHDRHLAEHNIRLATHDRHFAEHDARLGAHERHLREHDACLGDHGGHLGALDKTNDLVSPAYLEPKLTNVLAN
jgi:chromosome segregation ATPase